MDASAALSALLNAGPARTTLSTDQVHVPHLIDTELANGVRRMVAGRELDARNGWTTLSVWQRLGVTRYPSISLLDRVWELRHNLSAYDATYVALAENLGCSLLTADRRLGGAARIRCPVTVVPR